MGNINYRHEKISGEREEITWSRTSVKKAIILFIIYIQNNQIASLGHNYHAVIQIILI